MSGGPLSVLKGALYPWVSRHLARTLSVEAAWPDGATARVLFVHACLFNDELRSKLLPAAVQVRARGRVLLGPGLPRWLAARRAEHDLVVAVLPPAACAASRGLGGFTGPQEVRQVVPLDGGWEALRTHFSAKRRQVTNRFEDKHGLSARITHDPADLAFFRERMLEPLLRRRHGALALIDPPERLAAWFARGWLLLVEHEGRVVAGALAEVDGDTLLFRRSGVLDGDETHVKAGAQTALYHFLLRHALQAGLSQLDAMMSAPFPLDGVFRHKADWGAVTLPDPGDGRRVRYLPREGSAAAVRLLDAWPVIVEDPGGRLMVLAGSDRCAAAAATARGLAGGTGLRPPDG